MKKFLKAFGLKSAGAAVLFAGLLSLNACTTVHQVDRERLSRRIMQFDPEPNKQAFLNESRAIREGASGGAGQSAGGGCGCN